jgi:hypothetical protein
VRSLLFGLIVASLFASPAIAERLVQPAAPGFVVGYKAEAAHASIVERVPAGENVQVWTRMITTQRFEGLAERSTPQGFLHTLAQTVQRACSGARATDVRLANGATVLRADCPLNPATGKPETFFARTIADGGRMHVVQVAFRRILTAADVQWARTYLNGVTLCPNGSKEPACTAAK